MSFQPYCCDTAKHGPGGAAECWDGAGANFQECCAALLPSPAARDPGVQNALVMPCPPLPLAAEALFEHAGGFTDGAVDALRVKCGKPRLPNGFF